MDYFNYSKRLEHLKELIRKDGLQSPVQLANQFDCSEKTIRRMINSLREYGLEIKYSRKEKKYSILKADGQNMSVKTHYLP